MRQVLIFEKRCVFLRRQLVTAFVAVVLAAGTLVGLSSTPVTAQDLDGRWRGSGTIEPVTGGTEKVRCSMRFAEEGPDTFRFNGRCASVSGRTNVAGVVTRSGPRRYSGRGTAGNGARGDVSIEVRGRTSVINVKATEGTASIQLRR